MLGLAQQSIYAGHTKHVIFISGDQHWAEIMAKEIPADGTLDAATVFEVTASGIDQNCPFDVANSLRIHSGQTL